MNSDSSSRDVVKDEQRQLKGASNLGNIQESEAQNPTYHNINNEPSPEHYVKQESIKCPFCNSDVYESLSEINSYDARCLKCGYLFAKENAISLEIISSKSEFNLLSIDRRTAILREHVTLKLQNMLSQETPNNRLINKISKAFATVGINHQHRRKGIGARATIEWTDSPNRVPWILYSDPWYGNSYLVVERYDGEFHQRQFICQVAEHAIWKLNQFGCFGEGVTL